MGADQEISCETSVGLPIIDFSNKNLNQGTPEWDSVKVQVREALKEFGCFEALVNVVDAELREAVLRSFSELYDLPLETRKLTVSEKPFHGYLGVHPTKAPLYQSIGMDFEDTNREQKIEAISNILWPKGNPGFRRSIQSLSEKLVGVDQMVRRMILDSFNLEKYLDEHMNSNFYILRLLKYAAPETTESKLGLDNHTDKNLITILYQHEVDGLQVQTKDGKWIDVKPSSPDSFIVMIGDAFYAWLNGHVHRPFHRVMMKGNKTRYSTALFTTPKAGYTMKTPEELVDDQHPLLFKPFTHDQFLKYYLQTEAAQIAPCALATYCGV